MTGAYSSSLISPTGTAKTYLYIALLTMVQQDKNIAVITTLYGVSPSIMAGGRTSHSRFKIPLNIEKWASCRFTKKSGIAKLLGLASLIRSDKATMTKWQAINTLDRSMRGIMHCRDQPFEGKTDVFDGDFR